MPRIRDEILDCVIYLYKSGHEAEEGINGGGSGFLLAVACDRDIPNANHLYAVTNKHVIAAGANCVRLNTQEGGKLVVVAEKKDWICSDKDDLAIAPLGRLPPTVKRNALPRECLVTRDFVREHDVGIGDEVLMLGRFIDREGIQQNMPTARFGHISQMPGDPIEIEIAGKSELQEDAFLCEVRSIGGYSGSPVFILPDRSYARKGKQLPSERGILLGVDFCHIRNWTEAKDDRGYELAHVKVPLNSGMAGVIPGWKLEELIVSEKAVAHRTRAEEAEIFKRRSETKAATDVSGV
jgi:hypothetical protein